MLKSLFGGTLIETGLNNNTEFKDIFPNLILFAAQKFVLYGRGFFFLENHRPLL